MAWKWYSNTHEVMAETAVCAMPTFFCDMVHHESLRGYFLLGVVAPDKLFQDTVNHYYNVTPSENGINYGKVHKKVGSEVELIKTIMSDMEKVQLHKNASKFLQGIIDTSLKSLVFELGVISHYISDSHQPLHTDGKLRCSYEEVPHKIYEFDILRKGKNNLDDLKNNVTIKRPTRIKNPTEYILSRLKEKNKYYDDIIEAYTKEDKSIASYKGGRYEKAKDITQTCFDDAVNDIISIWASIGDFEVGLPDDLRLADTMLKLKECLKKELRYSIITYKTVDNVKLITKK